MSIDLSALEISDTVEGCIFTVKVVPGSSRNCVVGILDQALKIAVSSPPEGGSANKALLEVLAKRFNIRPAKLRILAGHSRPRKKILVVGLTAHQLRSR